MQARQWCTPRSLRVEDLATNGDDPFPVALSTSFADGNEASVEIQPQLIPSSRTRPGGEGHLGRESRAFVLHRPHLVHPVRGEELFQEKFGDRGAPGRSSSSMFGIG